MIAPSSIPYEEFLAVSRDQLVDAYVADGLSRDGAEGAADALRRVFGVMPDGTPVPA